MEAAEIADIVQGWFVERRGSPVDPHADFVDAAQMDSFDMLTLVAFCEERFDIVFTAADLESDRFVTVAGLAAMIQAHPRG